MLNAPPRALIRLRGPGNQGNWWHALVGAPFFLAFPMIWLRLRAVFSKQLSTSIGRRSIWIAVGLSTCGAISVQVPFRRAAKRLYCRPCDPTGDSEGAGGTDSAHPPTHASKAPRGAPHEGVHRRGFCGTRGK